MTGPALPRSSSDPLSEKLGSPLDMTGTRAAREAAIKKAAHLVRTVPIFGRATAASKKRGTA